MGWDLGITARCLKDDLGLGQWLDPPGIEVSDNRAVRCFRELRSQEPQGLEHIVSLRADIFSLHCGEYRGATWYDEEQRIVWLLAFGLHRTGARNDAYRLFGRLQERDELLPTADDYERLFEWRDEQLDAALVANAHALVSAAKEEPGKEIRGEIAEMISVSLVFEQEETVACLFVAVCMAFRGKVPFALPEDWLVKMLAGFFPESRFENLTGRPHQHLPNRALDESEILYVDCWGD